MFDSNLCDKIIDIGLTAKDSKQYLLVITPGKPVLYINQLKRDTLNVEVIGMLVGNFFWKTLKNTQILILNP